MPNSSSVTRVMFQSTPVITDGRTGAGVVHLGVHQLFQSTPVITDGRTQVASVDTLLQRLFQSTPVITDGRTLGSVP